MPRNEEGEFELVLGNRQLLSVFFIVVILLGVFFAIGYIVGTSAGRPAEAADTPKRVPEKSKETTTSTVKPPSETVPVAAPSAEKQPPPSSTPPPAPAVTQPSAGQTYLQLAATGKREAELLVEVLDKKGFRAMVAEVPDKPGTFRVLVGPLKEGSINQTRAELQSAGFQGNAAIKRTF